MKRPESDCGIATAANLDGLHVHVVQRVLLNHILQFKCFNGSLRRTGREMEVTTVQLHRTEARWSTHLQLCIGLDGSNKVGLHLKRLLLGCFFFSRQSMTHLHKGRVG